MRKKILSAVALALVLVLMLTACGKDSSEPAAEGGQTEMRNDVIVAQAGEPPSMDPHNCYASLAMRIYQHMFEGLLRADANGQLEPAIAESYSISDDGLTYTFVLRQDVKFQNGDPLTAKDVKFSLDRACASSFCAEATGPIASTEIVDDYTVNVIMKYPYEAQLPFFATTYLSIINENVVNEKGDDYAVDPGLSGTGAYQFESWEKGSAVTLVRNENYYGEKPAIEKVVYKNISEASAGDIAVESGNVDVYMHPSTVDIPMLMESDKVAVYQKDSYYIEYLGFNMQQAPFDKKEVREAVALCFDKATIPAVAVDDVGGVAANSFAAPQEFGHNEALENYPLDTERAKQLLADAGYPDGFSCTITTVDGPRKKSAEAVQAALKTIGIEAEIEVLEDGAFFDNASRGNVQIYLAGMTTLVADADPIIYTCFSTDTIGVTNYSNYSNPEMDALLMAARSERDSAKRVEMLHQVQQMIYDDIPAVPLYFRETFNIANPNLKGLEVEPNNFTNVASLSW